jgi:hypothetical protein
MEILRATRDNEYVMTVDFFIFVILILSIKFSGS